MVHLVSDMADLNSQKSAAGGKLIVIDFYATWCGPCKMIAPQIEEMSKSMSDVVFLKVDVDEAEDVAAEFNITAMPTFIFIKGGNKVTFDGWFEHYQKGPNLLMNHLNSGWWADGSQLRQAEGADQQE